MLVKVGLGKKRLSIFNENRKSKQAQKTINVGNKVYFQ
jgi:hypothetical protein